MAKNITIRRIVPNIYSDNMARSKEFYIDFLGMELAMDMGWILTFTSEENRTAQVSVFENTRKEPPDNTAIFLSVEVSDVEALYQKAKKQVWEIVYPLTDEPWGVRRFFVKDPNGVTINILMHL
ncbi:Uncharacterized conserved protein PhnB, glyoxalase superfamily [Sinomicrobium oceani]|uniref:Uncharacterized conserved protein PhnB, glyoxalase superfamily n=1 Tax=Sinomicrobium oceani TaxID=1150368 RepID=A0A1K1NWI1_9FLAO|nr:VOC family protein [Sinomicrobium oceani]SFW38758.1 Uncharacterized conserved protein PhnB, glyoxalase superfamily [Sinomicrobium oceani]